MEFKTYLIDRSEAILLSQKWISQWGKVPIKEGMYGNIAVAIENEDGEIMYVGFIWESPTEMAMIGFITRNPKVRSKEKNIRNIPNITNRLKECGELIGIEVIDHIIIGDGVYFSFKENMLI